jgi:hypothetical protein
MCIGIRYRADISTRTTKRGIQRIVHLRFLVRRSCPGCPTCQQVLAWAQQGAFVHRFNEVEHGRVYRLDKEIKDGC